MEKKPPKERNPFAGSLADNKYRNRIVPNKKKKERDNPKEDYDNG